MRKFGRGNLIGSDEEWRLGWSSRQGWVLAISGEGPQEGSAIQGHPASMVPPLPIVSCFYPFQLLQKNNRKTCSRKNKKSLVESRLQSIFSDEETETQRGLRGLETRNQLLVVSQDLNPHQSRCGILTIIPELGSLPIAHSPWGLGRELWAVFALMKNQREDGTEVLQAW